jgi:hypothetical protein
MVLRPVEEYQCQLAVPPRGVAKELASVDTQIQPLIDTANPAIN